MVRAAQRIARAANYCRLDDRRRVSADDAANSTHLWSTALAVFLRFTASPYGPSALQNFLVEVFNILDHKIRLIAEAEFGAKPSAFARELSAPSEVESKRNDPNLVPPERRHTRLMSCLLIVGLTAMIISMRLARPLDSDERADRWVAEVIGRTRRKRASIRAIRTGFGIARRIRSAAIYNDVVLVEEPAVRQCRRIPYGYM